VVDKAGVPYHPLPQNEGFLEIFIFHPEIETKLRNWPILCYFFPL